MGFSHVVREPFVIAAWSVLLVPFIVVTAYRGYQGEFSIWFTTVYWMPASILTILGVLPSPLGLLTG